MAASPSVKRWNLGFAKKLAGEIADLFRPHCVVVEVAGSVRRGAPWVHDIDLVVYPQVDSAFSSVQLGLFGESMQTVITPEFFRVPKIREHLPVGLPPWPSIIPLVGFPMPVELYLTAYTGCNLGALLQMRTGSKELNIVLSGRATFLGLQYRAGHGVFDANGSRIDSGTEDGIFNALGLLPIPVARRGGPIRLADYIYPGYPPAGDKFAE